MFNPNLPNLPQPIAYTTETQKNVSQQELTRQRLLEKAGGKAALGKTRYLLNRYKETLSLSQRQKEIGLGIMLGDANLQTQNQGQTYRLRYEGGNKHKTYVQSIHQDFEEYGKTYHIVAISGESYETLMRLITPYMHKDMYHKLPTSRKRA